MLTKVTHMMMPARARAALEVIEPQLVFQLPVALLNAPAAFRQAHEAAEAQGLLPEIGQQVLRGCGFGDGPLDQTGFLAGGERAAPLVRVGAPDRDPREPRRQGFHSLATGLGVNTGTVVAGIPEELLKAICVAAVFFGSMTYIGNGPNFMVKTVAEENNIKMPDFFSYIFKFSLLVLLPAFIIVQLLFM